MIVFSYVFMNWFIVDKALFTIFYLLLCIVLFIAGKAMENLRNRDTMDLTMSEERLKKLTAQTSFKQFKFFQKKPGGCETCEHFWKV